MPGFPPNSAISVIDIETTGLSAYNNRITEIGIVKIADGKIVSEYTSLINPEQFIPPYITHMTGITNELVYGKPTFKQIYPEIKEQIESGSLAIGGHNVSFDYRFVNTSAERNGFKLITLPSLCTCRLARRLNLPVHSKSLDNLSKFYGIKRTRVHRALDDARATAKIFLHFIDKMIEEMKMETLDEILSFQHRKIYGFIKPSAKMLELRKVTREFPENPGVYMMRDKQDEIIYVGKASNLRKRAGSYFYHNTSHDLKTRKLLRHVRKIGYQTTGSELSALILESKLIKKHKPDFNSAGIRYRRFPFIKIDVQNDYPKAIKAYDVKLDGAKYYGPFRSSRTVNELLETINREYYLRSCREVRLKVSKSRSPCLYHQIGQCMAPCNYTQSVTDYRRMIEYAISYIESQTTDSALSVMEKTMTAFADELMFEEAAHVRNRIEDLKRVLTNLELTSSDFKSQDFVIKCRNENNLNLCEVFLITSGKLIKNMIIDIDRPDVSYIETDIMNIYYHGNLFGKALYNISKNFTPDDIDTMKIIFNWIYHNNSKETLFKINRETNPKEIIDFVLIKG
jgi:DNA polymerase-3 subunit epsilon